MLSFVVFCTGLLNIVTMLKIITKYITQYYATILYVLYKRIWKIITIRGVLMHKFMIIKIILIFTAQYLCAQPQTSKSLSTMPPDPLDKSATKASTAMPIDPLGKKGAKAIRTKLTSLGFTVVSMKKTAPNRWQVTTSKWNKSHAAQANRGMVSILQRTSNVGRCGLADPFDPTKRKWDPTDKVKNVGQGTIMVEVAQNGMITLQQSSLKTMGLQAHPHKMKGKFIVK